MAITFQREDWCYIFNFDVQPFFHISHHHRQLFLEKHFSALDLSVISAIFLPAEKLYKFSPKVIDVAFFITSFCFLVYEQLIGIKYESHWILFMSWARASTLELHDTPQSWSSHLKGIVVESQETLGTHLLTSNMLPFHTHTPFYDCFKGNCSYVNVLLNRDWSKKRIFFCASHSRHGMETLKWKRNPCFLLASCF